MPDEQSHESTPQKPRGSAQSGGADSADPVRADGGSTVERPVSDRRAATESLSDRLSLRPGILLGAAAFVATYLVTYSLRGGKASTALNLIPYPFPQSLPGTSQVVGWMVYQAHFVPIEISLGGAGETQSVSIEPATGSAELPSTLDGIAAVLQPGVVHLIPVAMLLLAGFYAVIESDVTSVREGAIAGATVAIGYLVVVAASVVITTWRVSQPILGGFSLSISISPAVVQAVLIAGLVYPLVLGSIGGALAGRIVE